MNFVRERYIQLCFISFGITSGFGLLLVLWPRLVAGMLGTEVANSFNARLLGLVLIAISLTYVLALINEEAKNSLLFIATLEKSFAVIYVIVAIAVHQVSFMAIGMVVVDAAIALFGIMAIKMPKDTAS